MRRTSLTWLILLSACAGVPSPPNFRDAPFEIGAREFATGDSIEILGVRSTTGEFSPGSEVAVRLRYELRSRNGASLYFGVTTNSSTSSSSPSGSRSEDIAKGAGEVELRGIVPAPGHPHVTFYDRESGKPFGGVYFGSGSTLLAEKGWTYRQ